MLTIHKASFIAWLVFFGAHLLAHVPGLPQSLRSVRIGARELPPNDHSAPGDLSGGTAGRWVALAGALVGGAVLAVVLIPHFASWTAPGALPHHHDH